MKRVKKTYGHECGLSACFRQWRAKSHCQFIHGYALAFTFTFECADDEVDENAWVIDFGGLKPLKQWLQDTFDHKLLVARDDPKIDLFTTRLLSSIAQVEVVDRVGCEAFAMMAWEVAQRLCDTDTSLCTKARCVEVECREHGANAAIYIPNTFVTHQHHIMVGGNPINELIQETVARAVAAATESRKRRNVR